jgi:hypothetical protein
MAGRVKAAVVALVCALPGAAAAQSAQPVTAGGETLAVETSGSVRSYEADWLVNPLRELELGGQLRFIMAPESNLTTDDDGELRFTDVAIFRATARHSFGGRLEISLGADLLAKQPSFLDEKVFQGADGGARFSLAKSWALWLSGAGGPLLDDRGAWGEAALGLQARTSIDDTIRFQASLGGAATELFAGEAGHPWFVESSAHGEAVLRAPRGEFAGWLGVDYRIPIVEEDDDTGIDPTVRLNFQLGVLLGYVGSWDLYSAVTWVDRGDVEDPSSTLPILDGGFDQVHLLFGANRRWDLASKEEKNDLVLQMSDRPSS